MDTDPELEAPHPAAIFGMPQRLVFVARNRPDSLVRGARVDGIFHPRVYGEGIRQFRDRLSLAHGERPGVAVLVYLDPAAQIN
jgi:hypothetical protein